MSNKSFLDNYNWAKKNSNEHIIALKGCNDNTYSLNICIQKDENGICSRYCNCNCSHWSRSIEVEEMTDNQYEKFCELIEGKK